MDYHHHARLTVHGRSFFAYLLWRADWACARRQPSTGLAGRARPSGSGVIASKAWTVSRTAARDLGIL